MESEKPVKGFSVTPFVMDHFAFEAYAFLIESEGKKMIYSRCPKIEGNPPPSGKHSRSEGD
jgi:hypothetical protein